MISLSIWGFAEVSYWYLNQGRNLHMKHWESVLYVVYISLWNYRFFVLAFYYVLYSLIVWGYKLFNIILSCLLLRTFNTHIRVMTNALVWIIINLFYVLLFIVSHWDVCNRYCLRLVVEMRDYIYIQLPL